MAVDFWYASAIEALTALKDYELQENVRYVVLSREKEFGQSDIPDKHVKVHWNSDGQPFIVVGNKRFGCHHGHDKNAKRKQRKKASVVKESTHNYCKKRRRHPIIETKKVGCPAKVIMKEVLFFPQFKAEERRRAKTMVAARVRSNLHDGERRIIMEFKNDHENHPLGEVEGLSQRIDPDISYKIKDLAEDGVNDVGEMARHIENYVRESLQQVNLSPLNRRVHPLNRTIRYHMGKGRKGPDVQDDQLSLSALMQEEKSSHPNDVIFLRNKNSTSIDGHSEKFLMVYQSKWMKEMLVKYGNSMTLLDSTYKTTKYTLPMFVLAVRTNVDHQVVCVFIVDDESVSTLVEAISVVRENNPAWNPSHYMTDCDEKEMAAMERHFPASRGLICDFHRSQAWHRFIAKGSNRITKKKDTFQQLQGLAWARTLEEFNRRLNQLQKTDNWKQLNAYFTKQWLPLKEKWAQYCRTGELLVGVHTNNGLERLHGVLKNVYLKRNSRMSLTSMVSIMVKKFFPDKQQRYIEANLAPQGKNYAPEVPSFLHGRPTKFIKHCMDRMNEARLLQTPHQRKVSTGNNNEYPSCTCTDFLKTLMPCKHIFAEIMEEQEFKWENLPEHYRNSIYFKLDAGVLGTLTTSVTSETPSTENCHKAVMDSARETSINVRTLQRQVREKLALLNDQTYNVVDQDTLVNANSQLQKLYNSMSPREIAVRPKSVPLQIRKRKKAFKRFYFDEGKSQTEVNLVPVHVEVRNSTQEIDNVEEDGLFDLMDVNQQETHQPVPTSQSGQHHETPQLPHGFMIGQEEDLCNEVERIWNSVDLEIDNHAVGPYILTTQSIRDIKSLLSDEVMDSFLHEVIYRQETEKIYHLNCITMTSIFEGQAEIHHCLRRVSNLMSYDKICGAYNHGGCHWCLIQFPKAEVRCSTRK